MMQKHVQRTQLHSLINQNDVFKSVNRANSQEQKNAGMLQTTANRYRNANINVLAFI